MIYQDKFKTGLKDIGKNNQIKNRAMLEILENIGAYHSDRVGYGANDVEKTGVTWILLDWKLQVIDRPNYGQDIFVDTWGRHMTKASTYRDFEVYDENHKLRAIATSKWALIDAKKGRIVKIPLEVANSYDPEERHVFEEEEIEKLKEPEHYESSIHYRVNRKDIDINGHMHNLYYLDLAYEALPEEVYEERPYNQVRIHYRKEIKLGENVLCQYVQEAGKHIVGIYDEKGEDLHALIYLF